MMGNEFVEIMSVLFVVYSFFLNVDPNLLYLISAYIILFCNKKVPYTIAIMYKITKVSIEIMKCIKPRFRIEMCFVLYVYFS